MEQRRSTLCKAHQETAHGLALVWSTQQGPIRGHCFEISQFTTGWDYIGRWKFNLKKPTHSKCRNNRRTLVNKHGCSSTDLPQISLT